MLKNMKSTVTSVAPHHGSRVGRLTACILLITLMLPSLASCGKVWNWLWSRDKGGRPVVDDALLEKADGLPEGNYTYDPTVAHPGTNIHYSGKKDPQNRNRQYCVVIDPGHQNTLNKAQEPMGPNSVETNMKVSVGSQGVKTGQAEYELNLQVALLLRDVLYDRGYSVVMIRETNDVNISNKERAELANYYGDLYDGGAIFVRIHANGDDDPTVSGALACCQTSKNPYTSMYEESRLLSELLLEHFCEKTYIDKYSLPIWETDIKTGINWSKIPTTILEMGFLSNEDEDRWMSSKDFRNYAAEGIADGIDAYFTQMAGEEDTAGSDTVESVDAVTGTKAVTESVPETSTSGEGEADTSDDEGDSEDEVTVSPEGDSGLDPEPGE